MSTATIPDLEAQASTLDAQAVEDRADALHKSRRGYLQLRSRFVQKHDGDDRSATLAMLVKERQYRALLLYLMLLTVWPWLQNEREPLEAWAWQSLLRSGRHPGRHLEWSESTLSRTWRYLVEKGLVEKRRGKKGRLLVAPLLEDLSGRPYTPPSGEKGDLEEAYLTLPDRFWLNEDFAALSLAGIAVLLIVLKETNTSKRYEWKATQDQIADSYGISRTTIAKGLAELRQLGVLDKREVWVPRTLSKIRTTTLTFWYLVDDYATTNRVNLRANAARRRKRAGADPEAAPTVTFMLTGEGGEVDDGDGDAA